MNCNALQVICQDVTFDIVLNRGGEMKERSSIIETKNYGQISIKLKEIMDRQDISRYALAKSINVRFEVIDRWYNGHVEKLDLDILARICYVLGCTVENLLVYEE